MAPPVDLLVDLAFQRDDSRWVELLPETDISEVAQQIVELRRKIVINIQSFLDKLLATPLEMLEALGDAVYVVNDRVIAPRGVSGAIHTPSTTPLAHRRGLTSVCRYLL